MDKILKKLAIKLSNVYLAGVSVDIEKLDNGYVFHHKYYETIDDMKDDLVVSIKKFFN